MFDSDSIFRRVVAVLQSCPGGISEYDLLCSLEDEGLSGLPPRREGELCSLYQNHFLLFHLLYKLRTRLLEQRQAYLEIHCLKIQLLPYEEGEGNEVGRYDPLADYYLNIDNLDLSGEQIEQLLDSFWRRFIASDELQSSLDLLGLTLPVSYAEVRKVYKRLIMKHHPDRGGCEQTLKKTKAAYEVVIRYIGGRESTL